MQFSTADVIDSPGTSTTAQALGVPSNGHAAARRLSKYRINGFDVFFGINMILFVLMCVFAHFSRWTHYAGNGPIAVAEFLFYATVLMAAMVALWVWLRRYSFPNWLLALIEVGILLQFAGGLVHFGGARLYDHVFFYIRFDKYVHFINAFIAAIGVQEVFRLKRVPLNSFTRAVILFVVLGLGCVIEMSEYTVTLTIPRNGVGGYDDNMRDLIANLCGGVAFLLSQSLIPRHRRTRRSSPAPQGER